MEAAWPENYHSTNIPLFQRRRFSFPIDINFGQPRKSVSPLPTQILEHFYFSIPITLNTRQIS